MSAEATKKRFKRKQAALGNNSNKFIHFGWSQKKKRQEWKPQKNLV